MTRKDYELIAAALAVARKDAQIERKSVSAIDEVAGALAVRFEENNSRFDKGRFFRATGIE